MTPVLFDKNHIYFDTISSTNEFALSLKKTSVFREGLVVISQHQSEGRGQIGKKWHSNKGLNILISVVLEPRIKINKRFDIIKIVSLSLHDFLLSFGVLSEIKWPNDILVNKRKIAGVLIQNIVDSDEISYSIIGIGFNLNQKIFPKFPTLATSLSIELNKHQDCIKVRNKILDSLSHRLSSFRKGVDIDQDYSSLLFMINKLADFEKGNKRLRGIVRGVSSEGYIKLEIDNEIEEFSTKELRLLV